MNQKFPFTIIFCVLLYSLVLSNCAESSTPVPSPGSTKTTLPTRTSVPSATMAISATTSADATTVVITPDDLFSLTELEALNTPDSEAFCDHLPPPQIVATPHKLSLLSGKFALCSWENWPWVTNIAMDLDTGSLLSKDDERADVVMQNGPGRIDGAEASYVVYGLNSAQVNGVTTDAINYEYCEQDLLSWSKKNIQTVLLVNDGSIACVKTTEGEIALIRVEKIYPPNILSVEFSFAILRDQ